LEAIKKSISDFGGGEAWGWLAGWGWADPLHFRHWSYIVVKTRAPHLRKSET